MNEKTISCDFSSNLLTRCLWTLLKLFRLFSDCVCADVMSAMASPCQLYVMSTPLFKRKNVRGTRRKRPDLDSNDLEGLTLFGVLNKPEQLSQNALKWARYASLQKVDGDVPQQVDTGSLPNTMDSKLDDLKTQLAEEFGEEPPQVSMVLEGELVLEHPPTNNLAYTTLTVENLEDAVKSSSLANKSTNTFVLKELHFRDSPLQPINLESEYADAYGNVSDEDRRDDKKPDEEDDYDDNIVDLNDGAVLPSRHSEFYDLEVSFDDEQLDDDHMRLPELEAVKLDLKTQIERLEYSIKLRSEKLENINKSLTDAQARREVILQRLLNLSIS